ncbi:MAG: hypothetical protein HeimC2_20530 [Candidatus Heimdallarchaeota archaeon LC_2]|nr:MAG: hypothetical protein HeimC2_20530 [Candidatus Heimdallarchaeota archaeon LC_2]
MVVALIDVFIFTISKNGIKSDPRRYFGKIYESQADKLIKQEQENSMVYSELLNKDVRQYCYQSARLKDKYCICGRGVEYQNNQPN